MKNNYTHKQNVSLGCLHFLVVVVTVQLYDCQLSPVKRATISIQLIHSSIHPCQH